MTQKLRKHQLQAVFAINNADKGIINLPTGTGKSLIQAEAIVSAISLADKSGVYVIASPRILLSNQLLESVRDRLTDRGIDCRYLCVRSGETKDFGEDELLKFGELTATTSPREIRQIYQQAQRSHLPLIISAVYDSIRQIEISGIPIDALHCDEAQNLIRAEFSWIPTDFPAKTKYFYTATLRVTKSDEGLGMNNEDRFGSILYQRTPAEMIRAGEIVKPLIDIVNTTVPIEKNGKVDAKAVVEAFIEHNSMIKLGAKLLIVTEGAADLDKLVNSPEILWLCQQRPNMTIYDISSKHEPRINGNVVERTEFLNSLQNMTDEDEAMIFHIDILTEGIDVPGITGVMILNDPGPAKFLQTLGRATRLNPLDRERLYNHEITYKDTNQFIKPCAWIVVPIYGKLDQYLRDRLTEILINLRLFDFDPLNDVVTKLDRDDKRAVALVSFFNSIKDKINAAGTAEMIIKENIKYPLIVFF